MAANVMVASTLAAGATASALRTADHGGAARLNAGAGQLVSLPQRQQCRLLMQSRLTFVRRATPCTLSVAASQAEFAEEETAKFRTSIVKMLAAEPSVAGAKEKLADVCSKVFRELAEEYDGTFPVEPFGKMKAACDADGLPGGDVAVRAAIGWSRGYLYHDWNQWKSTRPSQ